MEKEKKKGEREKKKKTKKNFIFQLCHLVITRDLCRFVIKNSVVLGLLCLFPPTSAYAL